LPSVTAKLEFSVDPLSDTTPAWTDITRYVQAMSWFGGVQKDTDSPEAGGATFVLKNLQRRFEPEYTSGAYYPNIVPGRRFRVTITADGVNYTQGIYYAREWKVEYPDVSLGYSVVTVSCTDGFWRLSQKVAASMTPNTAETYSDVVLNDNPESYFPLSELTGKKMLASAGTEGSYIGGPVYHNATNPVLGDSQPGTLFVSGGGKGRSAMDDKDVYKDSGEWTIEAVFNSPAGLTANLASVGFNTGILSSTILLTSKQITMGTSGATSPSNHGTGSHHVVGVYDGGLLYFYRDGVLVQTGSTTAGVSTNDAGEYLYVGGSSHGGDIGNDTTVSHVAFYLQALSPTQVAAHATAALTNGYASQTAGSRIATLATDPLWSTAGIPTGTVTVTAAFQHGQAVVDELAAAQSTEAPGSLFYFNDAGNPAYESLLDTWTPAATFGDSGSEIAYSQIDLAYDDDLFNIANVGGEGLNGAQAQNSQSILDYGTRGIDLTTELTAANGDVTFGDTKEAGLAAVRVHPEIGNNEKGDKHRDGVLTNSVGATGEKAIWGKPANWCDESGTINGKPYGVAIFDHPDNPRHPTTWHTREYGLHAANIFGLHDFDPKKTPKGAGDMKLAAGKSVTFKYRILFHQGDGPSAKLDEKYKDWVSSGSK